MIAKPATPAVSTAVLKHFRSWTGMVPAGFFAYFLGNRTRISYWDCPEDIRHRFDLERLEAFSGPGIDDNIFDWLILLEAVVEAHDEFTMVALGAGWGRWLVSAAFAVKQFSQIPCRLIGVEAEPTHFQWMLQHFRDNDLDPAGHDLIEAAASGRSGRAWFYCGKPASWYGQSIIRDPALDEIADKTEIEYNSESARLVRTVDLAEVTERYRKIDYLHMDVQGAELDILAAASQDLNSKVKRVLVGTHSIEIEAGLRDLFGSLNWNCQYDVPINGSAVVDGVSVSLGDGVQVWINPGL